MNISELILSNSFSNKIETDYSIDSNLFEQINVDTIDDLSSLVIFLLEHQILEFDFEFFSLKKKSFQTKLIPFKQYINQSNKLLEQIRCKQNSQSIILQCLEKLLPLLTKTTYHQYPIALHVCILIIQSLSPSSLSKCFDSIFPICLITLDDPSIEMKFISFHLLEQFETKLTTTDLLLFNRANVILYGLEQNLSRRGDRLLFFECLLFIVFRWLNLIENSIYSGKHLFLRTSQLIERLIRDCLLETNLNYRNLILTTLQFYLDRLELFAIRHCHHLLELIDDSIENQFLRLSSLELLKKILEKFQPRIHQHRYEIMKILIRCLFKIIHHDKEDVHVKNLLAKIFKDFHHLTNDNYVEDGLKSLINTTELELTYRDHLQTILHSL